MRRRLGAGERPGLRIPDSFLAFHKRPCEKPRRPGAAPVPPRGRPIEMRLCTYKTRLRGLGGGCGREGEPRLLTRSVNDRCVPGQGA